MTSNEIMEWAKKSGMELYGFGRVREQFLNRLLAFAELAAAKEHKACLEIANDCAEANFHSSVAANCIRLRRKK